MKRGAIFLDRDGTINYDSGYISSPEGFNVYPSASEAIKLFNDYGFFVFVVTNQSGIARSFYSFADLDRIHQKMHLQISTVGAKIDKIYVSPYWHEGVVEPYNTHHEDRKPGLGLFKKAREEFAFNLQHSFMIGDRYSDIVFGKRAGLTTVLVLTGDGKNEFLQNRHNWDYKPDFITANLLAASKLIVSQLV